MTAGKMNVKEKIKDIHFYRAVSDISRPIADSTHTISQIGFYIVELMTAEGVRGQGYVLRERSGMSAALSARESTLYMIQCWPGLTGTGRRNTLAIRESTTAPLLP